MIMVIYIILALGFIFLLEQVIFDFNEDLIKLKKYKPKINIIIINGMILILATTIYIISQKKYDIDKDGNIDFDDVIALREYVYKKGTSN